MLLSGLIEKAKGQLNQTYATHIHPEFKKLPELVSDLEGTDMMIIPHYSYQLALTKPPWLYRSSGGI